MDYRSENKKDIADSGIKLLTKKTPQKLESFYNIKILRQAQDDNY